LVTKTIYQRMHGNTLHLFVYAKLYLSQILRRGLLNQ